MSIRDFIFDRRVGFLIRWHRLGGVIRQETLAEHQYFVARDAEFVARLLHHFEIAYPLISDVMMMAMLHDEPEKITGDISGALKIRSPELKKTLEKIEMEVVENVLFSGLPTPLHDYYQTLARRVTQPSASDLEAQIVKYADVLGAYLFAYTEVHRGNDIMLEPEARIILELEALTWDWLKDLRSKTGLP